jgi:hypothetical protein
LRESNLPRVVDRELPASDAEAMQFPRLTPAGIEPATDEEAILQREHV